ncbi:HTH domain-containing protein (plasmid) [Haloarcula salina]|uniref:HTH domain-containing protein n=1 Tax=Haloarcula salina TaxID=1429914 RepID=UPI003C6EFA4F
MMNTAERRPRARITDASENRTARPSADDSAVGTHVDAWIGRDSLRPATWERTRERLASLEATGRIESYTVREWGQVTSPNGRGSEGRPLGYRDVLSAFENWAEREGVTLLPGFQTSNATARQPAETSIEFVPPVPCLGVYEAGSLDAVFPHIDGERVVTVTDGLAGLRNRNA